jgi:hypothetical protein
MKKMKDSEICSICLKEITKNDNYYLLQSYKLGTYMGKKYYHWLCFDNKIRGEEDINYLKKQAKTMIEQTNKLLEQKNGSLG